MATTKINLTLPRHWNQCSTGQLEMIADVMQEQVRRVDRYHPFDMRNVKLALFFVLAEIEIAEGPNPRVPVEEQYYTCRFSTKRKHWWQRKSKGENFSLYLWQINYWLSPKAKTNDKTSAEYIAQGAGLLDWLDRDSNIHLTHFPYPEIKRKRHGKWFSRKKVFQGVFPDMDGFSWSQYRFASDTMQSYTQISNNLIKMQEMGKFTDEQLMKQAQSADLAKAMFLATIFNAKTDYVDTNTGIIKHDFHYESNQCSDNAEYFRGFPDTQWQVILFWWTGMMYTLSKRSPHVFKVQKANPRKAPSTPLEIYTATTATMQKYAGLTEDEVNHQSYSLVLEHLERLSKENEEMEKIRHK